MIQFAAAALIIFLAKFFITSSLTSATEYRGSVIVSARYFEYWETYVHQTCTRTVGSGKNAHTETYDCSYCDEHQPHWEAYDAYGHEYHISQDKYNRLMQQWGASQQFVNMHRDIDTWGVCGKNGDAYDIFWNKDPNTSDNAVYTHSYVNRPQASRSAFHYNKITKEQAKQLGLWDYPDQFDYYRQTPILGLESIVAPNQIDRIKRKFEYFDGYYGQHKHVKLFVLLFYDKPLSIAERQEEYWTGGNDNELVVCIGVNKSTGQLQWTKAFSWCIDRRPVIDCREDIMTDSVFNADSVYNAVERTIVKNFMPRNMDKDFSYLNAEIPTWAIVLTFILTIIVTGGVMYWTINNEYSYDSDDDTPSYSYRRY